MVDVCTIMNVVVRTCRTPSRWLTADPARAQTRPDGGVEVMCGALRSSERAPVPMLPPRARRFSRDLVDRVLKREADFDLAARNIILRASVAKGCERRGAGQRMSEITVDKPAAVAVYRDTEAESASPRAGSPHAGSPHVETELAAMPGPAANEQSASGRDPPSQPHQGAAMSADPEFFVDSRKRKRAHLRGRAASGCVHSTLLRCRAQTERQ
jgi:hypothetical protein